MGHKWEMNGLFALTTVISVNHVGPMYQEDNG